VRYAIKYGIQTGALSFAGLSLNPSLGSSKNQRHREHRTTHYRRIINSSPTMDMDNHSPPPNSLSFAQDTPPRSDVDEILRRKRKAREYKVRQLKFPSRRKLNHQTLHVSHCSTGCFFSDARLIYHHQHRHSSESPSSSTLQAFYFIEHYFHNVPLTIISNQGLLSLQTAQGKMRSISALQDMHW
jgi:hypothetical protein